MTFSKPLRITIVRILENYSDFNGWNNEENFSFCQSENILKTFLGKEQLEAFNEEGKRIPADFRNVIISSYPSEFVDALEAWFETKPQRADECENELNDAFSMHNSPWRFVNGEVILVDSDYLHTEVQVKTLSLLKSATAYGALEEFQEALQDLQSGETKDAVFKAHKSVESAMKIVLETDEHLTFGRLLSALIKSGIIPDYYDNFLNHFEQLMLGVAKERNNPGRAHGQGVQVLEVDRYLAEFTINLAGTFILFIIQRWTDNRKIQQTQTEIPPFPESNDIPF